MRKGKDHIGVTVVYFCHDGNSNYVMQKRSSNCRDENNRWDCGGGGIEFGDTVENTLKKEILEEYGTEVLGYEFLGYRDVHREHDGEKTHWIALDFKVHINKESVRNAEPDKFDEIGWFTLETLPTPLHSQLPTFIENYKNKL